MKSNKWFLLMMFALVLMLAACGPDRAESGEEAAGEGANGSGEEGSEQKSLKC
ncbi:hypothetical protein [Salinicoccus sp. CNSTN-B1]